MPESRTRFSIKKRSSERHVVVEERVVIGAGSRGSTRCRCRSIPRLTSICIIAPERGRRSCACGVELKRQGASEEEAAKVEKAVESAPEGASAEEIVNEVEEQVAPVSRCR